MNLTPKQRDCLWDASGSPYRDLRVISARPGTGKTTVVSAYCADLAETWAKDHTAWQGMAVLSYTNVAKAELAERTSAAGFSGLCEYPHFVGTIDSFVNQFLFLPCGGKAMQAFKRPVLVGEPHTPWDPSSQSWGLSCFDIVDYTVDGSVDFVTAAVTRRVNRKALQVEAQRNRIMSTKRSLSKSGYATQRDANYFALKTLSENPILATAMAARFPTLVIDEAQDMTEMQHAIIDVLVSEGLSHVVLIGDERQAIYEWNTAKPRLFVEKLENDMWKKAEMPESFRCSPSVCTAISRLAGSGELSPAQEAKNATYSLPVSIKEFSFKSPTASNDLGKLINDLCATLSSATPHGGAFVQVAILTRSASDAAWLRAAYRGDTATKEKEITFGDNHTKSFLSLVYSASLGRIPEAFAAYERLLIRACECKSIDEMKLNIAEKWELPSDDLLQYRWTILCAIRSIQSNTAKKTSLRLSDCIALSNLALPGLEVALSNVPADLIKTVSPKKGKNAADPEIATLFPANSKNANNICVNHPNVRLTFSTVHGVKGETYDGVLYVIKHLSSSCGCTPSKKISIEIAAHDILTCEEKRIQYVAVSRAAQCLWVAVEDNMERWREIFC